MARHNRITKKRSDKDELLADPSAKGREWLEQNGWKLSILALVIFVGVLGAVAAAYYQKTSQRDAGKKLFEAAILEQKAAAGAGSVQAAIDEYEKLISTGPGGIAAIQARMFAAHLYMETGEPAKAAEHFQKAGQLAGEDSLLGEINQVGLAQALAKQGKAAEAEAKLQALHNSAKFFPKAEILMDLAYIQAAAGKAEEAKKTLGKIKTGEEGLIAPAPVEDSIARIELGEITEGLKELEKAKELAAKNKQIKAPEANAAAPLAEGAVHGGGESKAP